MDQNINKERKTVKVKGPVWNVGAGVYLNPEQSTKISEQQKKYWLITVFIN
jgi:hypothetical protein